MNRIQELHSLSNDEIISRIQNILSNTNFTLLSFDRNHQVFGNMVVVISNGQKNYQFVTDRGEISCNNNFLLDNSYHIAGEDDTPVYLITEITKIINSQ